MKPTRAEEAANEIYKDGIELFGRRDKNGNLIVHPETMVGILRNACQRGYEAAEKDLALTPDDIKLITKIHYEIVFKDTTGIKVGDVASEVLTRFKQLKEGEK